MKWGFVPGLLVVRFSTGLWYSWISGCLSVVHAVVAAYHHPRGNVQ